MSRDCDKLRENLAGFVDNCLPAAELKRLEAHVNGGCPACQELLEKELHRPLAVLLAHELFADAEVVAAVGAGPARLSAGRPCLRPTPAPVKAVKLNNRPAVTDPAPVLRPVAGGGLKGAADASCKAPPAEVELADEAGGGYLLYRRPDGDYNLHCLEGHAPQAAPAEGAGSELVVTFDEAGLARVAAEAVIRAWEHLAEGLRIRSPAGPNGSTARR